MQQKKNGKNFHMNGRAALFAVMIGFCILAIIEIAYGQAQLKVEKERLALEETNHQTLQALELAKDETKTEQTDSGSVTTPQESSFMNTVEKTAKETEQKQEEQSAQSEEQTAPANDGKEYDMQIVFMGDSLLDHVREYDGIAALISDACNANVYNMSMGGTTAALAPGETADFDKWDSRCLLGVVYAILGKIDTSLFEPYKAGEILKTCDFSKTDYFVIEYGVNDFLAKIPQNYYLENGETRNEGSEHTYAGALDTAITLLHDAYPNAHFLIIGPHYCQFFNGETFMGDGYTYDNGYGKLIDYTRVCGYVANQHKEDGVLFYNAFEESGIDAYSADDCLEDGIHLTSEGRRRYVEYAIRLIKSDFYPEE
ncbi:MAG: SGNH/GDSL hydrolase family protein [Clostridium sp.]|nr:SGNH/GDSL hydrolase family protein [Clostridium sp.]